MTKLTLDKPATLSDPRSFDLSIECPNCFSTGLTLFYAAENIPVHSTVQTASPEEAVNFPRGRLRLGFCSSCGFVSNTAYDASLQEYCSNCEESQGFSPTFNAFAKKLAQTWIDRYQIRNKTILEIGCGKGSSWSSCATWATTAASASTPAISRTAPPRNSKSASNSSRIITTRNTPISPPMSFSAGTRSNISAAPANFCRSIRRTIGKQLDTIVLFELPDVVRVLKEGAFWDIYYEHCSYFSPGSLARLFRQSGFDVVELERCYDDQYLLIGARPVEGDVPPPSLPLEDDLEEMRQLVDGATRRLADGVSYWRKLILDFHAQGKKVVVWIALSKAVAFLTTLGVGNAVEFVVDINPFRQNKFMPGTGQRIVPPQFLAEYKPDVVILMNPIYRKEVQADLDKMGLSTVADSRNLSIGERFPGETI